MGLSLVYTFLLLPLAYPFVSGSTQPTRSDGFTAAPPPMQHSKARNRAQAHPRFSPESLAAGTLAVSASSSGEYTDPSRMRRWKQRIFPEKGRKTEVEKQTRKLSSTTISSSAGAPKKGLLSSLFFNYATPLAQTASDRRLRAEDAFDISEDMKMEKSVSQLASTYEHFRARALSKQQQGMKKQMDSDAWILTKALLWHERGNLIRTGMFRFVNTLIQAFPALLVSRLLKIVEQGAAVPASQALQAALALMAVLTLKMITENQYFHNVLLCATQVRGSVSGLLFDKALKLPGGGAGVSHPSDERKKNDNSSGQSTAIGSGGVLNLMQSDTSIIENAALQIHTTWDGLLQLAMYTYLLYRFLGPSVIYGCCVLVATIPINSLTLRILNRLTKYENQAKDARTKRTAESISNMKLLKLFGWEDSFSQDISSHRQRELDRSISRGVVKALNSAISNAVPALVLVVTLSAYAKTGVPIAASTIFTAISLFNQLRFPLFFYPMLIDSMANGRNAMRRIANFLVAPEIVPYVQYLPPLTLTSQTSTKTATISTTGGSIEMKHGNFLWSVSQSGGNSGSDSNGDSSEVVAPALAGVELKVNPGQVVAIVGPVGSGKSALIKGLLGELNPVPGPLMDEALARAGKGKLFSSTSTVAVPQSSIEQRPSVVSHGAVAYCSQEAWLPKGTIRDAIVFGREYNEQRYLDAVRDAGLDNDIVDSKKSSVKADPKKGQLSHETDVGEHGSFLSGGQRARVALARALYSGEETKVFLLDDVLAALDASVGSTVFERLTTRLRSLNAAVVMVTNDPSLPRRCDKTNLMGKVGSSTSCSRIVDSGSYDDLIARGHDLRSISATDHDDTINGGPREKMEIGSLTIEKKHHVMSNDSQLDPATLMSVNKNKIYVFGSGSNGTWSSCHADPEPLVQLENCPDSLYSCEVVPGSDESENIHVLHTPALVQVYNDTDLSIHEKKFKLIPNDATDVPPASLVVESTKSKKIVSADDSMSTGAVPMSTYVSYFKAARQPLLIAAMLVSYLTVNGAQLFQQYTVARWSEVARGDAMAAAMGVKYMSSLVNAAAIVSVFLWIRSFISMLVGVRASSFFHSRMLSSVFAAPLSFFDSTDSGQLLSRFGKETETMDRGVPESIQSSLFCFLQIFSSIGALAAVVTPSMAVPLLFVGILYMKTMGLFRPAARDLKRAETKTRSPIYTHFGEALKGAETIRSIPGGRRFWSKTHRSLTDVNLGVFHTVKSMDRWLSTRLESLGNLVVFMAAIASVYLARIDRLKAGSAGWGLTQALSITGLLTWAVRCLTEMETNMMSVQRVMELTNTESEEVDLTKMTKPHMPREPTQGGEGLALMFQNQNPRLKATLAPLDSEALLKSGWPWRGNIRFHNVSMRYNPSAPLVLRNVSLTVPAGSTLGVVGRTGSGKSSLLLTLFRLMEIEPDGGYIEIDGVDIRALTLKVLRQTALAIIPQDPTLFQGTVAYNLDATRKASESDMWNALDAASPSLAKQFREDNGLNSMITEGGKNLSQGQRQLVCLARALLRRSKILVLDEATSSVDSITDQAVQKTIRREFVDKGVTVITVAHRLETVLGYDNIAVLGTGSVLEYGSPKKLLQNPSGELRQLVEADRISRRKGARKVVANFPPPPVTAR